MRRRGYGKKGLVKFGVGEVRCALDIERVEQIVRPIRISRLASFSHMVTGMADYRGSVVPVVDLCAAYAGESWNHSREARWIVARGAGRMVALAVDRVFGVTTTETEWQTGNYPVEQDEELIVGVARVEQDLVLLVDLDRLIRKHVGTPKARQLGARTDGETS